jgi:hypothetical protein
MQVTSKVTSDLKQIGYLLKRLENIEKFQGEYGYFVGDIHANSGLPMVELVTLLNEGTSEIPARPFMSVAEDSMERWMQVNRTWKNDVWSFLCNGGSVNKLYLKYANIGADTIRAVIDNHDFADNSIAWAAMKQEKYGQFKIPLTETDEMYEAAKGKVVKR